MLFFFTCAIGLSFWSPLQEAGETQWAWKWGKLNSMQLHEHCMLIVQWLVILKVLHFQLHVRITLCVRFHDILIIKTVTCCHLCLKITPLKSFWRGGGLPNGERLGGIPSHPKGVFLTFPVLMTLYEDDVSPFLLRLCKVTCLSKAIGQNPSRNVFWPLFCDNDMYPFVSRFPWYYLQNRVPTKEPVLSTPLPTMKRKIESMITPWTNAYIDCTTNRCIVCRLSLPMQPPHTIEDNKFTDT
jgi:hypothetical protein